MFENQKVLKKIEAWCERLPYKSLKIEIELPTQTLTLAKSKSRPVGFTPPPQWKRKVIDHVYEY
jgi:hypothetical protein